MIVFRSLGLVSYLETWEAMKQFTHQRDKETPDEFWFLEHPPVYTQGQAGKSEHILNPGKIPIVQTDRGGQITYHGPGQLVMYVLMDLTRRQIGIKSLVCMLESILIDTLLSYDVAAHRISGAPGIYVNQKKIASIGLRVRKGCTYHGIALNVQMDLSPFKGIHPCGFASIEMTQISACTKHHDLSLQQVERDITQHVLTYFNQSSHAAFC